MAWLSYADRLYQLPLGVVGVAIGVVLLPELSRRVRSGDAAAARDAFNRSAEFALALTLPAAAALVAMPALIVGALFERGAFGAQDTAQTALAVALFALGLPAYVLQKVLQPLYFAREDTVTPLRFALAGMALNTAVAVAGAPVVGFTAVAAGTALAAWAQVGLLARGARGFGDAAVADARLRRSVPRLAAAAVAMGLALWAAQALAGPLQGPARAALLAGCVAFGGALYAGLVAALGAVRPADLRAALRRSR